MNSHIRTLEWSAKNDRALLSNDFIRKQSPKYYARVQSESRMKEAVLKCWEYNYQETDDVAIWADYCRQWCELMATEYNAQSLAYEWHEDTNTKSRFSHLAKLLRIDRDNKLEDTK